MDPITISNSTFDQLLLGNNEFKNVTLTVPAGATIAAGEMLQRSSTKYVRSAGASTEINLAVFVGDSVTNATESPVDVNARVCVAGRVNQGMLTVAGNAATDAQADLLRGWGILPRIVHNFSQLDRQ